MTTGAYAGLDPCVHCGFCLQACPTFLVTGDEADSPRGRIVLMQALASDRLGPDDPDLAIHLDRCLGCRACEPVCPSGVHYGSALEAAREELARVHPVPLVARLVHSVMAEPRLRRPLAGLARMVRPLARRLAGRSRLGFALGMLGSSTPAPRPTASPRSPYAPPPPPSPSPATTVHLFTGCIMEGLFDHVHAATERVLAVNGYAVDRVSRQGCCGALHAHSGQRREAKALARRNVAAFADGDGPPVVVNSAGCGAMLKEYGRLLAGDRLAPAAGRLARRVRDVTELLAECGPARGASLDLTVAYDPPCHLLHAQGVAAAPEAVLDAVPGLRRVRHDEGEVCCGSAGSYSLIQARMSRAVLDRKTVALLNARPAVVATGNPGCAMQIGAGLLAAGERIPVLHPVELLDWSYREAGRYDD